MKCEKIEIHTPYIKMDSFLKLAGVASTGGHAKNIIEDKLIKFNGEICTMRGKKLYPGDVVTFEDNCFEVVEVES